MTTGFIKIPATYRLFNVPLRMRVGYNTSSFGIYDACGPTFGNGEFEDYSLTVKMAPMPPAASFSFASATTCSTNVTFSNASFNSDNNLWDFGDGSAISTLNNTSHVYTNSGIYTVKLIAYNIYGSDTATQTVVIQNPVVPVTAACFPAPKIQSCSRKVLSGIEIQKVPGQGYFNIPTNNSSFQRDLTCTSQARLELDSSYFLVYAVRDAVTNTCTGNSKSYIDWNNDGVFTDSVESLTLNNVNGCPALWIGFTVPHIAVLDVPLRIRIETSEDFIPSSCATLCGQFVDFTIIVHAYTPIRPAFTASTTTACLPASVSFTNTSTNALSYVWDFGDGTSSTNPIPTHIYTRPGIYSVKLKACNGSGGCDSTLRAAYITIKPTHFLTYPSLCPGQSYPVGTHVYSLAGTYVDSLVSTSGCDSIITTHLTIAPTPNVNIAASGSTTFCQGDSVILTASAGLFSWQWYRSGSPIQGATSQTYTAKTTGTYWCLGYNATQCSSASNNLRVSVPCLPPGPYILRTKPFNEGGIMIFPNPGTGVYKIQSPEGSMEVFSYTGALIFSRQTEGGINEFDLSGFTDGIYLFTFKNSSENYTTRLILSRP